MKRITFLYTLISFTFSRFLVPCPGLPQDKPPTSADFLANSGIPTKIDVAHAIAHNKVMVIDKETGLTISFLE
jgi:hypothetical protein